MNTIDRPQDIAASRPLDPFTAEIIRQKLLAIAKQIEVNITRTAYSPLVYEVKDYSVGVTDHEGRLMAECGGGMPLFVADALGVGVKDGLLIHGKDLYPGDVLISNHSGTLGQHINNVIMYAPVFIGSTPRLAAFMAIIVHWIDIGGSSVGGAAPAGTTDVFQEGLHFRSIKLWSRGEPVRDLYRIIELNSRLPRQLMGDIEAQLSGCIMGRSLMADLFQEYSYESVRAAVEIAWQRAESAARQAIAAIPDGTYEAEASLDNDGVDLAKSIPIKVAVRVEGDEMTVDLSGLAPQLKGSTNAGRFGGAMTAARLAFKYLCVPDEAANDGLYRPLHLDVPEGTFLSASPTAAVSKYNMFMPTVIDTVLRAMAPALPNHVAGGHHANFAMHIFTGKRPDNGELFLCLGGLAGGWGASHGSDGPGPYKTMVHGDTYEVPVEVQEALYPVRIDANRLATNSGGPGEFRGGLGIEKKVTFLAPMTGFVGFERTKCPPWGVHGGLDAPPCSVIVARAGSEPLHIPKGKMELSAGDSIVMRSSGGGGYGNPLARDPQRVVDDVRRGFVTREAAEALYGVVVDDALNLRESETERLRSSIDKAR